MFQNNTVELNEIPKYEEVAFTALHKDYVKIVRMNAAITFLIGLSVSIAIYFIVEEIEKYYISGVIFLVGLLLGCIRYWHTKKNILSGSMMRCIAAAYCLNLHTLYRTFVYSTWFLNKVG